MTDITLKKPARRTGKTTAIILNSLSNVIGSAPEWIKVQDHYLTKTHHLKILEETIKSIVRRLYLTDIETKIEHDGVYVRSLRVGIYEGSDGKLYKEVK